MLLKEFLNNNLIYLDGGLGTLLQEKGLNAGELPERWNLTHSEVIIDIHKSYYDSGSNIVNTNTFGANSLKYSDIELENIIKSAINNAQIAREQSIGKQEKFIALDIGPLGKLLKPFGDVDFDMAVNVFAKTIKLGVKYGVDLIFIETMTDCYETKAAVIAAKENSSLPIFVSNAYLEEGILMTGAKPKAMVAMLEGLGVDAIGVNCSFGAKKLEPVVKEYLKYSSLPVILKPNAGLPRVENGKTLYDLNHLEFATEVLSLIDSGVRIVGGCCGTTPNHIKELVKVSSNISIKPITKKTHTLVSSYADAVEFGSKPILIGERINPTGKKKFKEALKQNNIDYILKEGIYQQEKGVHILDVNVGLPEIDEKSMLKNAVESLQSIINLPLQIDTSDISAMETALRYYNGKALINSVNGKKESIKAVFPLVKKYGGVVVCLTLDENGIPEKAENRLKIAKKILSYAKKYNIDKKDLIFDPLALTISADKNSAKETLKAIKLISEKLGCKTSLGVSNVSFGLPNRDIINANFFALALSQGMSAAIMNPYSVEMMKTYYSYLALNGFDDNCNNYINFASQIEEKTTLKSEGDIKESNNLEKSQLQNAIIKGLKDNTSQIVKELLKDNSPLDIVNNEIIPALNEVGVAFENKKVYLPQLLMSAEASKLAFEEIKNSLKTNKMASKCSFVIATVKGDIHDIGKNIVKLLLENYGFSVCDLGKDVEPSVIVENVINLKAPILGLSALMTTTVPSMEETIKLLRVSAPNVKIVVGGAVLTQEYADMIGADAYAKDAMGAVRYVENLSI